MFYGIERFNLIKWFVINAFWLFLWLLIVLHWTECKIRLKGGLCVDLCELYTLTPMHFVSKVLINSDTIFHPEFLLGLRWCPYIIVFYLHSLLTCIWETSFQWTNKHLFLEKISALEGLWPDAFWTQLLVCLLYWSMNVKPPGGNSQPHQLR